MDEQENSECDSFPDAGRMSPMNLTQDSGSMDGSHGSADLNAKQLHVAELIKANYGEPLSSSTMADKVSEVEIPPLRQRKMTALDHSGDIIAQVQEIEESLKEYLTLRVEELMSEQDVCLNRLEMDERVAIHEIPEERVGDASDMSYNESSQSQAWKPSSSMNHENDGFRSRTAEPCSRQSMKQVLSPGDARFDGVTKVNTRPKGGPDLSKQGPNQKKPMSTEVGATENVKTETPLKIVVYNVQTIKPDTLEMYFESKKRSGGGEVEHLQMDDDRQCAVITFKDPEVSGRVLSRKEPFILEGKTLTVEEEIEPPEVDPLSIVVENIDLNTTKDALELFFESKRKSGGGDIKELQYEPGSGSAVITFEVAEVIQQVLDRAENTPVVLNGCELHIYQPSNKDPVDPRIVKVEGLNPSTSEETLSMFMENKKKSGGGDVANIEYEPGSGMAKVTFEEVDVAARVLQMKELKLEGFLLETSRPESVACMGTPAKKPKNTCRLHCDSRTETNPGKYHSIIIEGVRSMTVPELRKLLKSKSKSGACGIEDTARYAEKSAAVVRFKHTEDASDMVEKGTLTHRGTTLSVYPADTSVMDSGLYKGPRAILVTNIKPDTKEDLIRLFFKNRRQSGGGEIDNVFLDAENGKAVITFQSPQSAKNVMEKHENEPLKLNKHEIDIKLLTPMLPPKLILEEKDPNKFFIIEAPCVSPTDLKDYLQNVKVEGQKKDKLSLCSILYSYSGQTILLEFNTEPDYLSLGLLFATTPIRDHMMTLQRVAFPTRIQVHNIEPSSRELVELYFQDEGHEDVTVEHVDEENKCLVLDCCSPEVVKTVVQKKHEIDSQRVIVACYYPEFGFVPLNYDATKPWNLLPTPYVHPLHADGSIAGHIHEFLAARDFGQDLLTEKQLFVIDEAKSSAAGLTVTCHPEYKADPKGKSWEELCRHEVDLLLGTIAVVKIPTLRDCLKEIDDEANEQNKNNEADVTVDQNQDVVVVAGWEPDVERISGILHKKNEMLGEQIKRQTSSVEEVVKLKNYEATLMRAHKHPEQLKDKFPNMMIKFTAPTDLTIQGLPREVQNVKLFVYENIRGRIVSEHISQFPPEKCTLLKTKQCRAHYFSKFRDEEVFAVLDVGNSAVTVYALTKEELKRAADIINKLIVLKPVVLQPENLPVLQSSVWNEIMSSFIEKYQGVLNIIEGSEKRQLIVVCISDIYDEVLERMMKCLEEHSVLQQFLQLDAGCLRLLETFSKNEIDRIVKKFASCFMSYIAVHDWNKCGYLVKGTKFGLPQVVAKLTEVASEVLEFDHPIDRHGMSDYFRSEKGKESLGALEMKFKVCCEVIDVDLEATSKERSIPAEQKESFVDIYRVAIEGGYTVKILQGDITKLKVEAIVNAANSDLKHSAGLARAIVEAGGESIQQECSEYVRRQRKVRAGNVFLGCESGTLPCDFVIHAVGPTYGRGGDNHENRNKENELYEAAYSSLDAANKEGLKSVALPALSTGIFNYPLKEATEVICEAALDFLLKESKTVKEVVLIDVLPKTVNMFKQSLVELIKQKNITTASVHETPKSSPQKRSIAGRVLSDATEVNKLGKTWQKGPKPNMLVTRNGLCVMLKKTGITKEQVDVIVNASNLQLDLSQGTISSAILKAAGEQIQNECAEFAPASIQYSEVIRTSSGKMKNVKAVYHGACIRWDQGQGPSAKILKQFIANCLESAETDMFNSIALPAIGTGKLQFPPQLVSQYMLEEILAFSQRHPTSSVTDVRIILYDKDVPTVKAFEDHVQRLLSISEPSARPKEHKKSSHRPTSGKGAFRSLAGFFGYAKSEAVEMMPEPTEPKSIMLRIYARQQESIDGVLKRLNEVCDEESSTIALDSPEDQEIIKKLDSKTVAEICGLERKYKVKIDVDQRLRLNRIHIEGAYKKVIECENEIHKIFSAFKKHEETAELAEQLAKLVQWEFKTDTGYSAYNTEINYIIQTAFGNGKPSVGWEEDSGTKFEIMFDQMLEVCDDKPGMSVEVRRKLVQAKDDGVNVPDLWTTMRSDELCMLVEVQTTDQEYQDVEARMRTTHNPNSIVKIERVQNPSMYKQYVVKRDTMEKTNPPGTTNERILYHGTAGDAVKNINTMGFNRSYCGKNATVHGNGVYFARDASYSAVGNMGRYSPPNTNGHKHVYQCRVLTGLYTKGANGMMVPPPKDPQVPHIPFDSVADNTGPNPGIFVIFHDTQAYPEYLITFT